MERSIMASRRDRCLELDGNWIELNETSEQKTTFQASEYELWLLHNLP